MFRGKCTKRSGGNRPVLSERTNSGASYLSEFLFFVKPDRSFLIECRLRLIGCTLWTRRSRIASAMVSRTSSSSFTARILRLLRDCPDATEILCPTSERTWHAHFGGASEWI